MQQEYVGQVVQFSGSIGMDEGRSWRFYYLRTDLGSHYGVKYLFLRMRGEGAFQSHRILEFFVGQPVSVTGEWASAQHIFFVEKIERATDFAALPTPKKTEAETRALADHLMGVAARIIDRRPPRTLRQRVLSHWFFIAVVAVGVIIFLLLLRR